MAKVFNKQFSSVITAEDVVNIQVPKNDFTGGKTDLLPSRYQDQWGCCAIQRERGQITAWWWLVTEITEANQWRDNTSGHYTNQSVNERRWCSTGVEISQRHTNFQERELKFTRKLWISQPFQPTIKGHGINNPWYHQSSSDIWTDTILWRETPCSSKKHCSNSFHVVNRTYNKITYGIYFVAYTTREFYCGFMEVLLWVLLKYIHSCNRARREE